MLGHSFDQRLAVTCRQLGLSSVGLAKNSSAMQSSGLRVPVNCLVEYKLIHVRGVSVISHL